MCRTEWTSWRGAEWEVVIVSPTYLKWAEEQIDDEGKIGSSRCIFINKTSVGGRNMKYCTRYEFTCVYKHSEILAPRTECIN